MATTVSQLLDRLRDSLGDITDNRWDIQKKLSALNSAVQRLLPIVLAYGEKERKVYEIFQEITEKEEISVNADGYPLTNLQNPIITNGVANVEIYDLEQTISAEKLDYDDLKYRNNPFISGNDDWPLYYILQNKLYILVNIGSYPVNARLFYVRTPKEMVTTTPSGYQTNLFELNDGLIEPVIEAARAECFRMADEHTVAASNEELFKELALSIARGGLINKAK